MERKWSIKTPRKVSISILSPLSGVLHFMELYWSHSGVFSLFYTLTQLIKWSSPGVLLPYNGVFMYLIRSSHGVCYTIQWSLYGVYMVILWSNHGKKVEYRNSMKSIHFHFIPLTWSLSFHGVILESLWSVFIILHKHN